MAAVSSVDPSSITSQRAGGTDCNATLSSVRRRYCASSRQGDTNRYRRELLWPGSSPCAAAGELVSAKLGSCFINGHRLHELCAGFDLCCPLSGHNDVVLQRGSR